ncbi:MAG TPA: thioredoxin domain-containing protein, partial [Proteobacteria bacterium]|nr:thioredoxin domain-containing protein [Pseudomonadota bacterium]
MSNKLPASSDIAKPTPYGESHSNRLRFEKSPYLLQHADNPVDWYPWGDEAFSKAKEENKPIFLSVGYSTCHWCHVMAHESFEDPAVAEILNRSFIPIKVDREERPEIDEIYMKATQLMTGSGGWPNSLFLTPEGKPFYAGTYFPPEDRFGRPGFTSILNQLSSIWRERRGEAEEQAGRIWEAMERMSS